MSHESQKKQILNDLLTGVKLTTLKARDLYGCLKLSNRISELTDEGFNIQKQMVEVKTRWGKTRVMQYSIPI